MNKKWPDLPRMEIPDFGLTPYKRRARYLLLADSTYGAAMCARRTPVSWTIDPDCGALFMRLPALLVAWIDPGVRFTLYLFLYL